jgi:hypothetical protein
VNLVTPLEFSSAFQKVVQNRAKHLTAYWKPWNAKEYTKLLLLKGGVLNDVASTLRLEYAQPWWTLDAIFCERFREGLAEYLSVAIEHENFPRRARYQINKLSIFNAPLKVLITYPGKPSKRGESPRDALLSACSEMLLAADAIGDFSHIRRQLIILGSDDLKLDSGILRFRYYLYEHGSFVELQV